MGGGSALLRPCGGHRSWAGDGGSMLPSPYYFTASSGWAVSSLWLWHCCFANVFHGLALLARGPRRCGALGMPININLRKMSDVKNLRIYFQVIQYVVSIFLLVAHVNFTYSKVLVFKSISVYLKIFLVEANFFSHS